MPVLPPSRYWSDIRWPQLRGDDVADWIAVLPLAAIEQHGPHLPLGTDSMIARAYCAAAVERLDPAVPAIFLPVQDIGVSLEHRNFPGTLTLPAELALQTWQAIGAGVARCGIRKLVMVTSHGGNSALMDAAALALRAELNLLVVTTGWHRFGYPPGLFSADELRHGIHGGDVETSLMLAAAPASVAMENAKDFVPASVALAQTNRWLNVSRPAALAWMMEDLNAEGAAGCARGASADKGRAALAHGADGFCALLREVHAHPPPVATGISGNVPFN